ncbi:MAG: flippase-like domain-containing protein [Bacteroidales bacterium]|nr:flippase-like domain-containing protein [Bacteroidales bacterium]
MPETDIQTPKQKKVTIGNIVKLVVFLGIGFFFIYWFLLKLDASQKEAIWNSFTHADYFWVGCTMCSCLLSHFVRALRWRLLYEPLGYRPGLNNTFGSVVVAYLANLAFPRLGEVMRCATLRTSDNIPIEKSLGTVVTERCIDILAFGVVVLIGLMCMYGQAKEWLVDILAAKSSSLPNIAIATAVVVVVIVGGIVLYRRLRPRLIKYKAFRKIDNIVQGGVGGLKSIFHLKPRSIVLFVVYSCLIYICYIVGGVFILQAFPETVGLGFGAAFVVYLFGSIGMTISQGGLGAYPVLVWQALALYGVSETVGLAAGWLLWGSQQVVIIVVGAVYIVYFSLAKKKK